MDLIFAGFSYCIHYVYRGVCLHWLTDRIGSILLAEKCLEDLQLHLSCGGYIILVANLVLDNLHTSHHGWKRDLIAIKGGDDNISKPSQHIPTFIVAETAVWKAMSTIVGTAIYLSKPCGVFGDHVKVPALCKLPTFSIKH